MIPNSRVNSMIKYCEDKFDFYAHFAVNFDKADCYNDFINMLKTLLIEEDEESLQEASVSDRREDRVIQRVTNYLEGHPYQGTEDDVEDICEEICDNLFDMDYYEAPPYLSHGIFTAVSNYIDELNN